MKKVYCLPDGYQIIDDCTQFFYCNSKCLILSSTVCSVVFCWQTFCNFFLNQSVSQLVMSVRQLVTVKYWPSQNNRNSQAIRHIDKVVKKKGPGKGRKYDVVLYDKFCIQKQIQRIGEDSFSFFAFVFFFCLFFWLNLLLCSNIQEQKN